MERLSVEVYHLKSPQPSGRVSDILNPITDLSGYDDNVAKFLSANMSRVASYSVPLQEPIVVPLGVEENGQKIVYTAEQLPDPKREKDPRIYVRRDPASPAMIAAIETINQQLAAIGNPGLSEDALHHHATLWIDGDRSSPIVLLTGPQQPPELGGLIPYYPHPDVYAVMTIRSSRRGPRHERLPEPEIPGEPVSPLPQPEPVNA